MRSVAKITGWLILLIVLAVFSFFVLSRIGKSGGTVRRLPDGSILELKSVVFTNGGLSYFSKASTGWRSVVAQHIPRSVASWFGWSAIGGRLTMGASGKGTNLGVFTLCEMARRDSFLDGHLVVFDEAGDTFDGGGQMGTLGSFGGLHDYTVNAWVPRAFPRRGKTIGLRFFERRNQKWQEVAEFVLPNPARADYPTWTAEPFPATRTNGNLTVTLQEFDSGLDKAAGGHPAYGVEIPLDSHPLQYGMAAAFTRLALNIVEAGRATNAWRPEEVEISDATGNDWVPFQYLGARVHAGGLDYYAFAGGLWPGESAWKLRIELSRIADFSPEELCTFTEIIIPGAGEEIDPGTEKKIGGGTLRLVSICGENAEMPGNYKWSTVKQRVNLAVRIKPLPEGTRLTLLKITDDSGRDVTDWEGPPWKGEDQAFAFKTPAGAKSLNFTFALHKSRFVDFLVRPKYPPGELNIAK